MGTPSISVNRILEEYKTLTPAQQRQVNKEITQIIHEQSKHSRTSGQEINWKGISIHFKPNKYVAKYEDIWQLESILGIEEVRKSLLRSRSHTLDTRFIDRLFRRSPYLFYVDQSETYLFSGDGELDESEGGPLKQLTALEALQRYGLERLEESKEKQYVRL